MNMAFIITGKKAWGEGYRTCSGTPKDYFPLVWRARILGRTFSAPRPL